MSAGTLWRRAIRRVDRRSATYQRTHDERDYALLCEAVAISNRLFYRTSDARGYLRVRP